MDYKWCITFKVLEVKANVLSPNHKSHFIVSVPNIYYSKSASTLTLKTTFNSLNFSYLCEVAIPLKESLEGVFGVIALPALRNLLFVVDLSNFTT